MTTVADHAGARCAACGAVLEPGAAFCGACGARTAVPVPTAHGAPGTVAPAWAADSDLDELAAPVWRRLVALLVDQIVAVVAGGLATLAVLPTLRDGDTGSLLVPALVLLVLGAAQWFAEAFAGRTLGGALLGTRTVSARTGRPAGLWAVLVRSVVQGAGVLLGGIGLYVVAGSGAWDEGPAQRGWHDKAAGTVVLRAPRRDRSEAPTGERAGVVAAVPWEDPTGGPVGAAPAVRSEAPTGEPAGAVPSRPSEAPTGPPPALSLPSGPAATTADVSLPEPPADVVPVAPTLQEAPSVAVPGEGLPEATIPTVPELGDLEHTRLVRRAPADAGPAPAGLALVLAPGERVVVTGPTLVGRRPSPPDATWERVVVADPGQSVSQSHLEVHPVEGGLEVLDRGSTNGTLLVDPDGGRWSLPPGRPAQVGPGWTLVLGTVRLAVEAA